MPYDFIRSRGTEALSPGKQKKRHSWTVLVPKAYCFLIGGIMLYVNKLWANMRGSKGGGVLRMGGGQGKRDDGFRPFEVR